MTQPTVSELLLLKTQPQQTKLYLSIYQPETALACQLTGTVAKGDRSLSYYDVTDGAYELIESGMTLFVGTSAGDDSKGRVRIRSATNTVLTVAENSHINWASDDYLTAVHWIEVTAIYPRIIQHPANPENVIFYKDYDVAYTTQNTKLGCFVNMGCDYAGFMDTSTGTASVYYSASGTVPLIAGTTLSYAWFFQGAGTTGSTDAIPGYIPYGTPGHFFTRLIVSGSNGAVDTSYRYVSIYDRPENGVNIPILEWSMENLSGSRDAGGYTSRIKIRENIPETAIKDGALVVIFAEDWYGNTKQSIGGNSTNRSSIVFVGYILAGTIQYNWRDSYVEFDVGSVSEQMKLVEGFSCSVESKASPKHWFELIDMDLRRAIYHYLKWHSTTLLRTNFEFVGADQKIQFFDADRTSLFDAINSVLNSALFANLVSDRQGKLFAEVDVSATDSASTSFVTNMEITKDLWMGEPIIDYRQGGDLSFLELGGIAYAGSTLNTFSALMSNAPGDAPAYRGKLSRLQGLALTSQAQLNTLTGNLYAFMNSDYPGAEYKLVGNFRNLDIAPQELLAITMEAADTPRGIIFNSKKFAIKAIDWNFTANKGMIVPTVSMAEVTQGFAGDTIVIPDVPPVETPESGGGVDIPEWTVPPLPVTTPPTSLSSQICSVQTRSSWDEIGGAPVCFISPTLIVNPYGMFNVSTGTSCNFNILKTGNAFASATLQCSSDGVYEWNLSIEIFQFRGGIAIATTDVNQIECVPQAYGKETLVACGAFAVTLGDTFQVWAGGAGAGVQNIEYVKFDILVV